MVILGIDLGKARTGLAICDKSEILAVPLCVIQERKTDILIEKICEKTVESKAEMLVVGLPKNMDGTEGESAISARGIAEILKEKTGLPLELLDERGTTITAHNYLNETNTRGKKRKSAVDAVAATVILQNYLDKRRQIAQN